MKKVYFPNRGDRLICVSNEWEDMVVGEVVGFLDDFYPCKSKNIPIIYDWVRGEEMVCFGVLIKFCWDNLDQLCRLNPYERYNALAEWSSVEMDKPKTGIADMKFADYMAKIIPNL